MCQPRSCYHLAWNFLNVTTNDLYSVLYKPILKTLCPEASFLQAGSGMKSALSCVSAVRGMASGPVQNASMRPHLSARAPLSFFQRLQRQAVCSAPPLTP